MSQFRTEEKDGVQIIYCPPVIDVKEGTEMEVAVKSWLLVSANLHILDFKDCLQVKNSAYRFFVLYNQALKSNNKSLFCVNMNQALLAQFKQDGLTSVFVPSATIEEAKRRSQPSRPMVDVEFINPFILATKTVLETQAQTPLSPGKAYLRKPSERIPMEIAGVLGLSCAEFKGSISICFRAEVFLKIYENMVGEKHEQISSEIEDAAGELLNIIFGQAKTVLNDQKGYTLEKALPTVLVGEKLKLHHQSRNPAIVLPFESPAGAFHLEILVDRT
jgi:chemotaxis protein CheX